MEALTVDLNAVASLARLSREEVAAYKRVHEAIMRFVSSKLLEGGLGVDVAPKQAASVAKSSIGQMADDAMDRGDEEIGRPIQVQTGLRAKLHRFLRNVPEATIQEIADGTGEKYSSVGSTLTSMVAVREVQRTGRGRYQLVREA